MISERIEKLKNAPCSYTDQLMTELEKEGWEQAYSFHSRIPEQWNMACDEAESIIRGGYWEVVMKLDEEEGPRKDTVTYLYKRRLSQKI